MIDELKAVLSNPDTLKNPQATNRGEWFIAREYSKEEAAARITHSIQHSRQQFTAEDCKEGWAAWVEWTLSTTDWSLIKVADKSYYDKFQMQYYPVWYVEDPIEEEA